MIDYLQTFVIGVIQGITEFLPISSSAHLVIIPYLFKWDYKGLGFDVSLHMGTALAIIIFFYKDWINIFKSAISKKQVGDYPANLLWQIVLASIPAGLAGLLIDKYVESVFHSILLIAFNLTLFGFLLWVVDKYIKKSLDKRELTYKHSFIVGLAQCLALIPGISRSGITILSSRALGLSRETAAKFSFILGTPAMFGAFVYELKDLNSTDLNLPFLVGVAFSFVSGFLAIKYLLIYLRRGSFAVFAWYRLVLAVVLLLIYFYR